MKVCFLGLGSMGSGVCRNLLNKGYALQVWNRSPEKAAKVAGWGAEAFATPQEAARGAGVVMSCLSSVAALKAVAGGASGVFSCMGEGMAFYDMGTWDIESVLALDAEAAVTPHSTITPASTRNTPMVSARAPAWMRSRVSLKRNRPRAAMSTTTTPRQMSATPRIVRMVMAPPPFSPGAAGWRSG